MSFTQADLDRANRQVSDGEAHVLKQKQAIEKLRALGATTVQAEALLASFESMLLYHREHRDRIAAELANKDKKETRSRWGWVTGSSAAGKRS